MSVWLEHLSPNTTHIYPYSRIQLQYNGVWGTLHGQTSSSQALMYLQADEAIIRLRYWIYLDYIVRAEFTTNKYEWGTQKTLRSGANPSLFEPGELTLQDVQVSGNSLQTRQWKACLFPVQTVKKQIMFRQKKNSIISSCGLPTAAWTILWILQSRQLQKMGTQPIIEVFNPPHKLTK